ncbi:ankyrin repeat domain-containing protein [Kistimonas asteriae]|uniref:ankyrin repeat domain-containing protein n=1 Tax=Kistimonas asteriae TaxID=517724 RepID=UPI001BA9EA68|nr:ankyrin repeat domain-containing protein [Kistimonas asteriae]
MATPVGEMQYPPHLPLIDILQEESCDIRKVWRVISQLPQPDICNAIHERVNRDIGLYAIDQVECAISKLVKKKWIAKSVNDNNETVYSSNPYIDFCLYCHECDLSSIRCYLEAQGGIGINKVVELPYSPEGYWSCPLVEAFGADVDEDKRTTVVEFLKEKGARIPHLIYKGETFLHVQARFIGDESPASQNAEAIRYFIDNEDIQGKCLSRLDSEGRTPVEVAVIYGNKNIKACLEQYEIIVRVRRTMAIRVCDYISKQSGSISVMVIKKQYPKIADVEGVMRYAIKENWLSKDVAAIARYGHIRFKINTYLKVMTACRDGNAEIIGEVKQDDKRFWHFYMNMPVGDLSGEDSCPLQEALESKSESRELVIKVLAEAGARFSDVDNTERMYSFLIKQFKAANILAFQSCLQYFDTDGEMLLYKSEKNERLQDILQQEGVSEFLDALEQHRSNLSQKKVGQDSAGTGNIVPATSAEKSEGVGVKVSDNASTPVHDTEAVADFSLETAHQHKVSEPSAVRDEVDTMMIVKDYSEKYGIEAHGGDAEQQAISDDAVSFKQAQVVLQDFFLRYPLVKEDNISRGLECLGQVDVEGFKCCFKYLGMEGLCVDDQKNTPVHYVAGKLFFQRVLARDHSLRELSLFAKCARVNSIIKGVVRFCVAKGCLISAQNKRNQTALHRAILNENFELAVFFIRQTKNIKELMLLDIFACSPLMLAVKKHYEEVVVQLLNRGVEADEVFSSMNESDIKYFKDVVVLNEELAELKLTKKTAAASDKMKVD